MTRDSLLLAATAAVLLAYPMALMLFRSRSRWRGLLAVVAVAPPAGVRHRAGDRHSPLYGVAGLTITPHVAAGSVDVFDKTVAQMFRNIGHVSRGEPVPERDSVVG